MRRNQAGQFISFQAIGVADGLPVNTGTAEVYHTIALSQTPGAGTGPTSMGNGEWVYSPTAAETNGDAVSWTFVLAGAINQTINTYPVSYDPTDATNLGLANLDATVSSRATEAKQDTMKTAVNAIPTTMVGTDNAALATELDKVAKKDVAQTWTNQDTDTTTVTITQV